MIRDRRIIRQAAARIAQAANRTHDDLQNDLVEQEAPFTERLLTRIQDAIDGFETKGITWRAKTLTDRGPRAQEAEFGADFVGVLEIRITDYSVEKGFLAQAKMVDSDWEMSNREFKRLKAQCDSMLTVSADSFVFVYSPSKIKVIPASAVVATHDTDAPSSLDRYYSRSVTTFYEEHFGCFIGDHRISAPTIDLLGRLRARYLLLLQASQ
jgi:hypothetical protein